MNTIIQNLKSRTVQTALVMAVISAIEAQSGFFSQFVPPDCRAWLVMLWPVLMIALRQITTQALDDK